MPGLSAEEIVKRQMKVLTELPEGKWVLRAFGSVIVMVDRNCCHPPRLFDPIKNEFVILHGDQL